MSYLIGKKKKIQKRLELAERRAEEILDERLCKLINDVRYSSNFPKNAKKVIYDFSGNAEGNELSLVKNLKETYVLSKDGITKVLNLKCCGELNKLTVKKINVNDFVNEIKDDTEYFEKVCKNLQSIINKYKIEIDWKNYEIDFSI